MEEGKGSEGDFDIRRWKEMKLSDFDYPLPEERIAQEPCKVRDQSRMMVLGKSSGIIEQRTFLGMPEFLKKGDVLVINDSKVFPARLVGRKTTGGAVEILLLADKTAGPESTRPVWEVMLRPGKRLAPGTVVHLDGECSARVIERVSDKKWILAFETGMPFEGFLEKYGQAPLPPYIKRKERSLRDLDRYQTVYARIPGSVAAPTAGLHFSEGVLGTLKQKGIPVATVTLHVGPGTFSPIETEDVEDHRMEEERFEVTEEAACLVNEAERVVCVGTTSTRVIESATDEKGRLQAGTGRTGLFIYPGYRFKKAGGLLTNFHLPKSSLFLLVCAFAGRDLVMKAYQKAIEDNYRFYSYGDCMLIL
jgi:S-adenosylmethionine:tRNA ribosyltransferase-isomerase